MDGSIYIAILPVAFLLFYIYKKDIDKEPRGLLIKLFIFGAISTIPLAIIELVYGAFLPSENLPTFMGTFVAIFIEIAMVEEFGKWIVTYLCTYRKREFNHPYDGIVYCVFASLGFACVENIFYVINSGISTGIMRAVLAVPGHAVDAVFMAYFFSKSKDALVKNNNSKSLIYLILSMIIPTTSHAIYDGLIFHYSSCEESIYLVLFFAFVITSYILSFIIIKKYSKVLVNFDGTYAFQNQPVNNTQVVNNQFIANNQVNNTPVNTPQPGFVLTSCINCGAPLNNGTCSNCGFQRK